MDGNPLKFKESNHGDMFRATNKGWRKGRLFLKLLNRMRSTFMDKPEYKNAICIEPGEFRGSTTFFKEDDQITNLQRYGDPDAWMNDVDLRELSTRVNSALKTLISYWAIPEDFTLWAIESMTALRYIREKGNAGEVDIILGIFAGVNPNVEVDGDPGDEWDKVEALLNSQLEKKAGETH